MDTSASQVLPRIRTGRIPVGSPDHFRWLSWILWTLIVLNLMDAVFTLLWVQVGLATEANLLLRKLVEEHPFWFLLSKVALVSCGSVLLWRRRENPLAVFGIFGCFFAYYCVVLQHLGMASWVVERLVRS